MGCASSSPTTPEERVPDLAIKTLMLAQRRKVRCTQATALAAASFLPLASPNDVLEWIKEPVLEASTDMPGVDMQRFDLDVPINVSTRSVSTVPTTLVLPSGTRVGVRVDPLVADAPTLSIVVPIAALQALGQPSVRIYAGEHDVAPIGHPSSSLSTASHGAMCPITPEELEDECPIILPMDVPERLRGGDNVCVVCKERLDACISDGTEQLVPLRQLYVTNPSAHALRLPLLATSPMVVLRSLLLAPHRSSHSLTRAAPIPYWMPLKAMRPRFPRGMHRSLANGARAHVPNVPYRRGAARSDRQGRLGAQPCTRTRGATGMGELPGAPRVG